VVCESHQQSGFWPTPEEGQRKHLIVSLVVSHTSATQGVARKVVGWSVDRTLQSELPLNALQKAIANRQPPPGLIYHSDRGVQYACEGRIRVLRDHQKMPSMSRPGNPYDNASCESFIKTLKREEIYANDYRDLEHKVESVEKFIEHYYNRCRLHSALGYRPPEEFEEKSGQRHAEASLSASTVTFGGGRQ
jgi:transposase InsO family protein